MYKAGEKYLSYYEDLESNLEKGNYIGAAKDVLFLGSAPVFLGLFMEYCLYVRTIKS